MATVALRKTTWAGLTALRRGALRLALDYVDLGDPAEYEAPGGVRWCVFDDHRVDLRSIAILGCVAGNLGLLPDTTGMTRAQVKSALASFVAGRVVLPSAIDYTGQANPYQLTLNAQRSPTPDSIRAADSVPPTWTPVAAAL